MKKIAIAGVEFTPAVLDFNVLCVMEECGAPMNEWGKLDMSLLRGYLAACLDISAKHTALNSSTDCNAFVWVNALKWFFSGNFSNFVNNGRNSC